MGISDRRTALTLAPGTSSYFTAPEHVLDPALFDSRNAMHQAVRIKLLGTLYGFWRSRHRDAESWSTVWVAGSGASYQWAAARSPGDLDVLIGVNYVKFRKANPEYTGLSDAEISDYLNAELHEGLTSTTANMDVGGSIYEVTWYINPGATDIRDINPYAAYNVSDREWTVAPDPNQTGVLNSEWDSKSQTDYTRAADILSRYSNASTLAALATDPGHRRNAEAELRRAIADGAALFDEIHLGRHAAFSYGGKGFGDWANYRWQSAKANGVQPATLALKHLQMQADAESQIQQYGQALEANEAALIKAALWRTKR